MSRIKWLVVLSFASGCYMFALSRGAVLDRFKEEVLPRAAFELNCPADQLVVEVLTTNDEYRDGFASTVGVRGCGKRYVYLKAFPAGWVLQSSQAEESPK